MTRFSFCTLTLALCLAANAATVRTASETFVTNKIAAAIAAIPEPDFSPSNATLVATIEETSPAPGDYAAVSNAAMSAVQPTNMPMLARYPMRQWGENIDITGDEYIDVSTEYHGTIAHRIFDGWRLSLSTDFWDQFSDVALSGSYNDLTDTPDIPSPADFSTSNETLVATIEATAPAPGNYATVSNKAMTALQSYTETDPTIPGWARAANKPTYTAAEVGATTPADVTAAIREQSLGGIWDAELEVWWTPRMRNGNLTYEATTNVNLNAVN